MWRTNVDALWFVYGSIEMDFEAARHRRRDGSRGGSLSQYEQVACIGGRLLELESNMDWGLHAKPAQQFLSQTNVIIVYVDVDLKLFVLIYAFW